MKSAKPEIILQSSERAEHSERGILLKCSLFIGLVLALGSCFWWFVLPVIELVQSDRGWGRCLATGILCLLFGIPGLLLLYSVNALRLKLNRHTIKNFCGVFYGMLLLLTSFLLFPILIPTVLVASEAGLFTFGSLFIVMLILLPIYVAHAKNLMREAGIVPLRGELLGRQMLQLLACLLGMSLMSMLGLLEMMDLGVSSSHRTNQIELFAFLVVLLLPYLLYKLSVRILIPTVE